MINYKKPAVSKYKFNAAKDDFVYERKRYLGIREGVMQTEEYIKWFLNTRQLDPV